MDQVLDFSTIDTQEKAYCLGFISADGYLKVDLKRWQYLLSISLAEQDYEFLCKLRDYISPNSSVHSYKRKNRSPECRLNVWNKELVYNLQKWNLHQNKTFTLDFPYQIAEHYYRHWVRGYFDGDGCVYVDKDGYAVAHMSGNLSILGSIRDLFNSHYKNRNRVYQHPKNLYRSIAYGGKTAEEFFKWIYHGASLCMQRKYSKALPFLRKEQKCPVD